jgi:asparagine synthetase B (glutamine-hydrolysing)
MASIAGMAGSNGHIAQVVAMLDLMQHRGPDTRNLYEQDDICAGVQAAALSPARGQGIASADGVTVLLDGDLYNPREPGQSDADVALGLYKRSLLSRCCGPECG